MSLACWLIIVIVEDVVGGDVAAVWALSAPNGSLVSLVILVILEFSLGEDVIDEIIERMPVGLAGVGRLNIVVCDLQREGCGRGGCLYNV